MNRRNFLSWAGKISVLAAIVPKVDIKPDKVTEELHPKFTTPTALTINWNGTGNVWVHNSEPLKLTYVEGHAIVTVDRDPF